MALHPPRPANLIVTSTGWVKICDFGIARFAQSVTGLTGSAILGSPIFMAPAAKVEPVSVVHRLWTTTLLVAWAEAAEARFVLERISLVLWDPWWLAGGLLFLGAAWWYRGYSEAGMGCGPVASECD